VKVSGVKPRWLSYLSRFLTLPSVTDSPVSVVVTPELPSLSSHLKARGSLCRREEQEALQETDRGAYWPASATPREPSLNQYGKLIPRDDDKLVRVLEELRETANGHAAELKIVSIPDDVQRVITKTDGHEQVREVHRTWE
jgi:hypothetical protein